MAVPASTGTARGALAESDFERIFDLSPIPTWEQDYTEVIAILDDLRATGVTDLISHLREDPTALPRLVGAVIVRHANRAAIEAFDYDPAEHDGRISLTSDGSLESFAHQIATVWEGGSELHYEYLRDPTHPGPSQCALHWTALQDETGPDYRHVVLSIADIAGRHGMAAQLQRRADQLQLLHAINRDVASHLDVDRVLARIVSGVQEILRAEWVELVILDEDRNRVVERLAIGLDNDTDATELLAGIGGWVLRNSEPAISAAAQSDPRNTGAALVRAVAGDIGSLLVTPLTINGVTRGTLAAGARVGGTIFSQPDLEMLALMAAHASFAVQNAMSVERIEAQIEARDRLAASVSHELRTPLTSISGLAQALEESWSVIADDERRAIVALIVREAGDAGQIVEDLLLAARSELGQVDVANQPMELRAQADAVVRALEEHELNSVSIDGGPVTVLGDPVRVRQIVRNLVTNAHRYGGDDICLMIEKRDDGFATLAVVDNGDGVDSEIEATLFEPFTRSRSHANSIGLGLNVSSKMAEAMDGSLGYSRDAGRTAFTLRLPLATAP